jgi:hypothetical protein
MGDRQMMGYGLAQLSGIAVLQGDVDRAGRLWGALEAEAERGPVGQWESEREKYAARVLGAEDPKLDRAREQGRRLSFEAGIAEALEET